MDILEKLSLSSEDLRELLPTVYRCLVIGKTRLDLLDYLKPQGSVYQRELRRELKAWGISPEDIKGWSTSESVAQGYLKELSHQSALEMWEHLWEHRLSVPLITSKIARKIVQHQLMRHFVDIEIPETLLVPNEEFSSYIVRLSPIYSLELTTPPGWGFTSDKGLKDSFEEHLSIKILITRLSYVILRIPQIIECPEWLSSDLTRLLE